MRFKIGLLILLIPFVFVDPLLAFPYLRDTGLTDVPTAYVMSRGIFDSGIYTTVIDQRRKELGFRVDFGLFNFAEMGFAGLKKGDNDYVMGNLKLLVAPESGTTPALSVGVDNFGEKLLGYPEYKRSIYGVISKQFNLPFIHIISGHLGVGNGRYISEDSFGKYLHGAFIGLNKDIILSSFDSQIRLMFEVFGDNLNAGLKYMADTGFNIGLGFGQIDSNINKVEFHLAISFTNAPILKKITQTGELAKRAVKIANELSLDAGKVKTDED